MMTLIKRFRARRREQGREGAATVEFAVVAPVLLTMALGLIQWSRAYDVQQELVTALRQGARLAGMDRQDVLQPGESTNDKIIADVRNFLDASGMDGDRADVRITSPGGSDNFDLDAPENELGYFELSISMPMDATTQNSGILGGDSSAYTAKVVFRNARGTLVN